MDFQNTNVECLNQKKLYIFDMDGTIYLGGNPFDFAFFLFFYESLRITASAAEILGCLATLEAVYDCLRSVRVQDGFDVLLKDVAEIDHALTVKAAGNHCAVGEDAELILETIAEEPVSLDLCVLVGPLKALSPLEKDAVADSDAASALHPVARDAFSQVSKRY